MVKALCIMRISFHPAFILHQRPYRETSLLLDVLTQDYGRISLIARGVRTARSPLRGLLQPFNPLLLSWQGRTELMTLTSADLNLNGVPKQLQGTSLLGGFYLNEVLTRVLQKQDPHPQLYTIYQHTLIELQTAELQEKTLRVFEKKLLAELGYGLQLDQQNLDANKFYRYLPEQGFVLCNENEIDPQAMIFSGKSLLAINEEQFNDDDILRDAKRLMRLTLAPLLGSQPLHSRKLFMETKL